MPRTSPSVGVLLHSVYEVFTDSCRAKHDFRQNRRSDSQTSPEEVNEIMLVLSMCAVQLSCSLVQEICTKCCWAFVSSVTIGGGKAELFLLT